MNPLRTEFEARESGSSETRSEAPAAITLLAPVWGPRHIERFLDLVLPTWLSPGNIPALAAEQGVVVRFLTRLSDMPRIEAAFGVVLLRTHAQVEFCAIDDLLAPDCLPVTLTLAFHRGVAEGVKDGKPRSFLLLNSDFALADGSVVEAARQLRSGARLLLSPSLRVDEESIRPTLRAHIDASGVLALAPRDMVRTALDHLHPTVVCSQINQTWMRAHHTHQLYWRIDDGTMLAHGFCLFVLGLTTSTPPPPAESFADYGMGPNITGDAPPVIMDHSDRFLALEIAPHDYESGLVEVGRASLEAIAGQLQQWTTAFHRRQALTPLVFAAGPAPSGRDLAAAHSDTFMRSLMGRLGQPWAQRQHPNWIGGLGGWTRSRREIGVDGIPSELSLEGSTPWVPEAPSGKAASRKLMRRLLIGGADRSFWQPYHGLSRCLRALTAAAAAEGRDISAMGATRLQSYRPLSAWRGSVSPDSGGLMIVGLDLTNWSAVHAFLRELLVARTPGLKVVLLLTQREGQSIGPMDVVRVQSVLAGCIQTEDIQYLDLRFDRQAEFAFGALAETSFRSGPLVALGNAVIALAWPFMLASANLFRAHRGGAGRQANVAVLTGSIRSSDTKRLPA